jgi:hydroxymethylbilane synthase
MTAAMSPQADANRDRPQVRVRLDALPLRVGTRGSPLALIQTRCFLEVLRPFCPVLPDTDLFEEHIIRTTGDVVKDRRLAEIGGKGLFAKEIHEALVDHRIDVAVHSLKDLETALPTGIVLACTLKRDDARDALILGATGAPVDPANPLICLPAGAIVGTSSMRRQAQVLHVRPDVVVRALRGNVQTRLNAVASGLCTATLLASAGLKRLGLADRATIVLDTEIMVPAAGQGIVGVTVRADDRELRELLGAIEDPEAKAIAAAERAMLRRLDGSCRTPIGGHARLRPDGQLCLTGLVARSDGSFLLKRSLYGAASDAARIGGELATSLRADSPADLFV